MNSPLAWWQLYGAKHAAEVLDRRHWIDDLAAKYGIVRIPESLTEAELSTQKDRVERAMGRRFYPAVPAGYYFEMQSARIPWDDTAVRAEIFRIGREMLDNLATRPTLSAITDGILP